MHVQIIQVDEADNSLIISEREAWVSMQICLFRFLFPSFNSQWTSWFWLLSFVL